MASSVTCLWEAPKTPRAFVTAVSLHSHTFYSHESLDFIPAIAAKNPILHWLLRQQERRCRSVQANFATAYWTPPLTPQASYQLERSQIEDELNLASVVSLSDHDSIEAPLQLCAAGRQVPIAIEWSVPLAGFDVHLGVHNLPAGSAAAFVAEMHAYTAQPRDERLKEILAALCQIPDVLVVLNHPLWDIGGAGASHRQLLHGFLTECREFVHAFELNGLRCRNENDGVMKLAETWNRPVVAGGDRHGCEANAVLNLTCATSMAEFVDEVRTEGRSHVLFMPPYRESLKLRMLQTVIDAVQEYPFHPLGCLWEDRVFHADRTGAMQPLSALWTRPPQFIDTILGALRMLEKNALRWNTRLIRNRVEVSERLSLRAGDEVA